MPELPEDIQGGFDAEYEALQEARRRIESNTSIRPQEREMALGRIAEREMQHVRRVQAEVGRAEEDETFRRDEAIFQSKEATARAQGGAGVRQTATGGLEVQQAEPTVGVPGSLQERTAAGVDQELAGLQAARREADANPRMTPERRLSIEQDLRAREQELRQQQPVTPQQGIVAAAQGGVTATQGSVPFATPADVSATPTVASATSTPDPRGTLPAATVAGTPRRRGTAQPAPPSPPQPGEEGYVKPEVYTGEDPYDPRSLYAAEGPIDEIRDTFLQQGKLEEDAGLASAADVMSAAEEIKAQREMAYDRMREDMLNQEQRLRELDVQLGTLRNMQFDSSRLFRNGHGVSLALGIAVGAMQQTMNNVLFPGSNATNTALSLVNDAIDRDLREQAANFQQGVTTLGMGRTSYELARQMGMDHTAAYEYASATSKDYVARQLNARRLTMGAGVAAQQAHRAEQELVLKAMEQKNASLMALAASQATRIGGGRPAGPQPTSFAPMVGYAEGVTPKMVRDSIGAADATRLRGEFEGASSVFRIVDRLRRLVDQAGTGPNWATRIGGEIRSLSAQLQESIRKSNGMGALDAGALTMTEKIAGDPTSFTTSRASYLGQLAALRSEVMTNARERAEISGGGLFVFNPDLRIAASSTPPTIPGATDDEPPDETEDRTPLRQNLAAFANDPMQAIGNLASRAGSWTSDRTTSDLGGDE